MSSPGKSHVCFTWIRYNFSNLQTPVEFYADTCDWDRDERDVEADVVESYPQLTTVSFVIGHQLPTSSRSQIAFFICFL